MIGSLRGAVLKRSPEACIVEVGGVGYRVACSSTTLAKLPKEGSPCHLWTHLHVREDALSLYGFATEGEQVMFEALIGVSGVGPKVALQVCSSFTSDTFRRALVAEDVAAIASVPGIGKKTAHRIVIDLKEKLGVPEAGDVATPADVLAQARSALENLGYSPGEILVALSHAVPERDADVEDVVKSALKALA